MERTITKEAKQGDRIILYASGDIANPDWHGTVGEVALNKGTSVVVTNIERTKKVIESGYDVSEFEEFNIGPDIWSYEILAKDWDNETN